ncbi:hypothetical protein ACHAW6_014619 [Cyclotella cf. meneghiniana]
MPDSARRSQTANPNANLTYNRIQRSNIVHHHSIHAMSHLCVLLSLVTLHKVFAKPSPTTAAAAELSFLSGVADTTQRFSLRQNEHQSSGDSREECVLNDVIIERHNLICFHKGPFQKRKNAHNTESEKCCNALWLQGLIETHQKQYCLDRIARIPDVPSPAFILESLSEGFRVPNNDVRPMYYLAMDHEIPQTHDHGVIFPNYRQIRRVKARDEHRERETIRDLPNHGISSYSPFHLVGFMPGGHDIQQYYSQVFDATNNMLLMNGRVNGTLSQEGGMHRSFYQRVTLSWDKITLFSTKSSSENYLTTMSVIVFLPLMESVFIDADDPFLVEYHDDSPEAILCRSSLLENSLVEEGRIVLSKSKCNIQFLSSETIDIEQPSFASRQYVVAFRIDATMEFSINLSSELLKGMQVGIDYGTALHIRYLSPLSMDNAAVCGAVDAYAGMVPISIQQPILYSANFRFMEADNHDAVSHGILDTHALVDTYKNPEESAVPDPIIVHVAAGFDGDYWWVTSITMLTALIGGFMIMKSVDSVSMWC